MFRIKSSAVLAVSMITAFLVLPTANAQITRPTILKLDEINVVNYNQDIPDLTKAATSSAVTTAALQNTFQDGTGLGDIVAANGQGIKGTHVLRATRLNSNPDFTPGQAIADITRNGLIFHFFEIQAADGTTIGTITAQGFSRGTPPPGAPSSQTAANLIITGGSGAFVGVRGFAGSTNPPTSVPNRQASIIEDPAYRRINGGGTASYILTLYPAEYPRIVSIAHADSTLVSAANPAAQGETLTITATGLGPTRPGTDPGQPFPLSPAQPTNSPVSVTVNGQPAPVSNSIGWPSRVNQYRVDFQVPADTTKGTASVSVSAAWMAGPAVLINVQ